MSYFDDVNEFHKKFELPYYGDGGKPNHLDHDVLLFRLDFMLEELTEMIRAARRRNLAQVLDGLVDLTYVALGTATLGRLPFDEAWHEVHRANMAKERAAEGTDPRSVRGHAFDVVKPADWVPPDIEAILKRHA